MRRCEPYRKHSAISLTTMATSKFLISLALVLVSLLSSTNGQGLKLGFYQNTCPKAEVIVRSEITRVMSLAPSLAGPLLRMHFHDCFVTGCDGSILLNATNNILTEKDSPPNLSLRGYQVIETVKAELEKACPGIVSCADVLALVARDVVVLSNGPSWAVPTGRRDGRRSLVADTISLPPPTSSFRQLLGMFAAKGLDAKDLVVLSAGHTIGTSHCSSFAQRIYNFTGKGDTDPSMDKNYVAQLKIKCSPNDLTTLVEMDPGSFKTFDTSYFKQLVKRRSLFTSDHSLLDNGVTKAYIMRQAVATNPFEFFRDFGVSMIKMGNIQVLTGNQGEIRKKCAIRN